MACLVEVIRRAGGGRVAGKRFWSNAVLIVTVVVAGAGVLPTLLLQPAATEMPAPAPVIASKAIPMAAAEPEVAPVPAPAAAVSPVPSARAENAEPKAEAAALVAPALLVSAPAAAAAIAPSAPALAPAAAAPAPASPAAVALPPVQPVEATASEPPKATAPERPKMTSTTESSPKTRQAAAQAKRKRSVRPATFSIRDFFASRR
jgi:hypothetical protein